MNDEGALQRSAPREPYFAFSRSPGLAGGLEGLRPIVISHSQPSA